MVLVPALAVAQGVAPTPELVTDRPDFTESAVVVPLGSLQAEAGATLDRASDGVRTLAGPELLLRWGCSTASSSVSARPTSSTSTGAAPGGATCRSASTGSSARWRPAGTSPSSPRRAFQPGLRT